jgi:type II secretory pathway pseudopilin PulG
MRAGKGRRRQGGFTYLFALFLLVLLGLGLAGTGEAWSIASRRAHERELLWVGNQYARAIKAYYNQSPGVKQFPAQLEDLVEDRRFPEPRRHLRQLYPDPISHERFDIVLSQDGRIGGVRSHSDDTPMKQDEFPAKFRDFKGSTHYADWLFTVDGLPGSPVRPNAATTDATNAAGTGAPTAAAPATATPGTPGTVDTAAAAASAPVVAPPAPRAPVKAGPSVSFRPPGS